MIETIVNIVVYGSAVIFAGVIWFLIGFSKAYQAKKS